MIPVQPNTISVIVAVLAIFGYFPASVTVGHLSAAEITTPIARRAPWSTSHIAGTPEAPLPYVTERAFPKLKFNQCVDITTAPGTDRLFVVEQGGKIFSFPNKPDVASADLVIDLAKMNPEIKECYALAFHPNFSKNRFCYVCYIKSAELDDGSHIARFRVSESDPPALVAGSETTILTWLSGGHNGCCLKFGPDGYLYISTGDGSGPNPPDSRKAGQDVTNLLSSILRIDVDQTDAGRNYQIPMDNPFFGQAGVRGEIWAYGFRNPWRMSFDRRTGDLWVGDVGWELWEMLHHVDRGGNYGWSIMEGRQPTNPEWSHGPTPILPPTIDHPHSESSSITDGLTYYGTRLKELQGSHLYGDYDTGKIWAFEYTNSKVLNHREIADTTHRIVSFGEDSSGECYLLDHTAGTIHQLITNPLEGQKSNFPQRLSESGLFSKTDDLTLATGVIPYSINTEAWQDFATSQRCIAIPGMESIPATGTVWTFPRGTVLVKTLALEMKQGDPASRRRVETQILHFDGTEWMPYTFEWNAEQTDATLVQATGVERTFTISDPQSPGGIRRQAWMFAGRAECQRCHNKWSGSVLAFNHPQLDRQVTNGERQESQFELFEKLGVFDQAPARVKHPTLCNPYDISLGLEIRARSYLHANCAHCHRLHAGSAVLSKMHYDLPLEKTDMVNVRPTQGTFGLPAANVIAPGDPFRSVLMYRMAKLGGGRMPHIGSTEVDLKGVELIHDWLLQLPTAAVPQTSVQETILKSRMIEKSLIRELRSPPGGDDTAVLVKRLLNTTSGGLMLLYAIQKQEIPAHLTPQVIDIATHHSDSGIRDLFERFLPADKRVKRLGSVLRAEQILALRGDVSRGKTVFFETNGVACKNCHRINGIGKEIGPDLTSIGKKYSRAQLLESLLEPSRKIDPNYVVYLAELNDGRILSGLQIAKTESQVVLKDAQDTIHRIDRKDIEQFVPQRQSLMPDLLLKEMTAQQVGDLLEYLSSLK